jgi:hypothetical protein
MEKVNTDALTVLLGSTVPVGQNAVALATAQIAKALQIEASQVPDLLEAKSKEFAEMAKLVRQAQANDKKE